MIKDKKAKGARNERRSMALLQAAGYAVTKSGGSLGCWDLVGISKSGFCVCQTKTGAWPGTVEMETLRNFQVPPNCQRIVHRWMPRKRLPDLMEL